MTDTRDDERDLQKLSDEYDGLLQDEFNATRKLLALKDEFDALVAPSNVSPRFAENYGVTYFTQYDRIEDAAVRNDVVVLRRPWISPLDRSCPERPRAP
jgi:hypothetical protein